METAISYDATGAIFVSIINYDFIMLDCLENDKIFK